MTLSSPAELERVADDQDRRGQRVQPAAVEVGDHADPGRAGPGQQAERATHGQRRAGEGVDDLAPGEAEESAPDLDGRGQRFVFDHALGR